MKMHNIKLEDYNGDVYNKISPESYKKEQLPTGTWLIKFECKAGDEEEAIEILLTDAATRFSYLYSAKVESSVNGFYCTYVAGEEPAIKKVEYENEMYPLWELDLLELEELRYVKCTSMQKDEFEIVNKEVCWTWFNFNLTTYEYGSLEISENGRIISYTPWLWQ